MLQEIRKLKSEIDELKGTMKKLFPLEYTDNNSNYIKKKESFNMLGKIGNEIKNNEDFKKEHRRRVENLEEKMRTNEN